MGGMKIVGQALASLVPVAGQTQLRTNSAANASFKPAAPQLTPPLRIGAQTADDYFGWLDQNGKPEAPQRSGGEAHRVAANRQGVILGMTPRAEQADAAGAARASVRSDRAERGVDLAARVSVASDMGQLGADDEVPAAEAWSPPVSLAMSHEEVAAKQLAAKSVGVDPAKANFWKKLGSAVFTAVATGLFIAGSVATGGALAVAGAALLGVITLKLGGDALCAGLQIRNARAAEAGQAPPHALPLGDDSLGNLLYLAMTSKRERAELANAPAGSSTVNEQVAARAAKLSAGIMFSLAISTAVVAGGATVASGVVGAINAVLIGGSVVMTGKAAKESLGAVAEQEAAVDELIDYAARAQEALDGGQLLIDEREQLTTLLGRIENVVGHRAAQVEEATLPTPENKALGVAAQLAPDVTEFVGGLTGPAGTGVIAEGWRAFTAAVTLNALTQQRAADAAEMTGLRHVADALLPPPGTRFA